jgi:hypothetical protein
MPLKLPLSHSMPLNLLLSHSVPLKLTLSHSMPLNLPLSHSMPLNLLLSHSMPSLSCCMIHNNLSLYNFYCSESKAASFSYLQYYLYHFVLFLYSTPSSSSPEHTLIECIPPTLSMDAIYCNLSL